MSASDASPRVPRQMPSTQHHPPTDARLEPLAARVLGIIGWPHSTLVGVVAHPRWLGVLALWACVNAGLDFAFLSTETGRLALVDQQVSTIEGFGGEVTDAEYEALLDRAVQAKYLHAGAMLLLAPVVTLAVAGAVKAVFALLGQRAPLSAVLAVVAHAGVISMAQRVLTTPVNFSRGSMSSPTNLSVFVPMLDERSPLSAVLGSLDLFTFWWLGVLALGLAIVSGRPAGRIGLVLVVAYLLFAGAIALVRAALGGL